MTSDDRTLGDELETLVPTLRDVRLRVPELYDRLFWDIFIWVMAATKAGVVSVIERDGCVGVVLDGGDILHAPQRKGGNPA